MKPLAHPKPLVQLTDVTFFNMTQIFGTKTCHACISLKTLLQNNGIDFEDRDISENPDAREEIINNGFMKVPVLKVKDQYVAGFEIEKVKEILGIK